MSVTHAAWLAVGWLCGWLLFWRMPRLERSRRTGGHARRRPVDVAVIVPARDEAHALPGLLAGVVGADDRVAEVVVVDDGSSDRTAEVARAAGARVVATGPAPAGTTGKSWACTTGVRATTSRTLVFVDADVSFAPGGLTAVIDRLEDRGGLVSVEPFQVVERFDERLSALFGTVSVMGTGVAALGRSAPTTAFGPVLACRRADYEAVGGHAADRGAIAEDVALAARFVQAGRPVLIEGGGDLVSFRMYPLGVRQLVEGWTKNIATGAGATPRRRLLAVVLWIGALLSSAYGLAGGLAALADGRAATFALAAVVALAFAAQLGVMFRQLGSFGWWAPLAYPVLAVAFVAIFARSLYLTLVRREVSWKGRVIPLHPAPPDP